MDGTTSLMMVVPKYTYFAFYYSQRKIKDIPILLEFLGFTFFYPTTVVGPTLDFQTYQDFIHKRNQYANQVCTVLSSLK